MVDKFMKMGQNDLDKIMEKMSNTYELPPLDFIG